jgi:hypothetical protein
MRICAKCQTENEEVNNYCQRCGHPLIVKERPVSGVDGTEGKKKNIQICPRCRVLHERGEFCVKCKTRLVPKDIPEEEVRPPASAIPEEEVKPRASAVPEEEVKPRASAVPEEKVPSQVQEAAPQQGEPDLSSIERKVRAVLASHSMAGGEQDPLETEPSPVLDLPEGADPLSEDVMSATHRPERRSRILSPLSLATAGILLLIGFVIYLSSRRPESGASVSGEAAAKAPVVSSSPVDVPAAQGEEQETEKIRTLLEDIRKANLRKDIDLFMSCYSVDFKDPDEKRRSTLESWKTFTYLDLSYTLNKQTVSGDRANVTVEWVMKTFQANEAQPLGNRIVIDASLKKEDGRWRIKESKTAS